MAVDHKTRLLCQSGMNDCFDGFKEQWANVLDNCEMDEESFIRKNSTGLAYVYFESFSHLKRSAENHGFTVPEFVEPLAEKFERIQGWK